MKHLLYFMRDWHLDENLIYKDAAVNQAIFIRDTVCQNLLRVPAFIVSTHTSKSCTLPVYYFKMLNGIKIICRGNFYDWKISVETPVKLREGLLPLDLITGGTKQKISDCYLEGFKEEWGYGPYNIANPAKKFTIEVSDKYALYVIMHTLKNALPNIDYDETKDNRSVEDIVNVIKDIYDKHGNNDIRETDRFGKEHIIEEPMMRGYEILWKTYYALDGYDNREKHGHTYDDVNHIDRRVEDFAKYILEFPDVHKTFLMEEELYKEI